MIQQLASVAIGNYLVFVQILLLVLCSHRGFTFDRYPLCILSYEFSAYAYKQNSWRETTQPKHLIEGEATCAVPIEHGQNCAIARKENGLLQSR
jgi:hypothetical protein